MGVLAIVGTVKGAFFLRANDARQEWSVEGPEFKGWKVDTALRTAGGRTFLALSSDVYGAGLQASDDLKKWKPIDQGPRHPAGGPRKTNRIWKLYAGAKRLYAGIDEAALFASEDGGSTWQPVAGLNDHPTRAAWMPGAGGLCLHAILEDPRNPARLWAGISAVGVFRSDDGGRTWTGKNRGVPVVLEDKELKAGFDVGYCVHSLVADPDDANLIYRQDHAGMYRTRDGGDSWEKKEEGLPSRFGFPLAMDPRTRALYAFPLESDEYRMPAGGKFRIYRSRNGGDSWEALARGLPETHAYMGVLRGALATDGLDPCGVYAGTTSGTLHFSRDRGDSWTTLPFTLPRVLSITLVRE